ncbi:A24 family peptidase [Litoribacterium kuwaitense]|uniref:A24 family peptidase n=1 Tax=Litoribacterium kuwaitense TaxID=1398745 RepID=UPI001FE79E14|nr:A24 family peptidase [Litoribacterium kuwaitense]
MYEIGIILLLIIAFYTDIRSSKIPNALVVVGLIVGLLYHGLYGVDGLTFAVIGFIAGLLPTLFLYVFKALGAGDVKLFAAVGTIGGASFVLTLLIYAVILSGLIGLLVMLLRWAGKGQWSSIQTKVPGIVERETASGRTQVRFPFMYAVAPAAVLTFALGYIAF